MMTFTYADIFHQWAYDWIRGQMIDAGFDLHGGRLDYDGYHNCIQELSYMMGELL